MSDLGFDKWGVGMKLRFITGFLLLCVTPVLAEPKPVGGDLTYTAYPTAIFEAGMEKGDGAPEGSSFLHAKSDGDLRRQGAELASWVPGDNKGKRLHLVTKLKTELATRASCALEAWDDKRAMVEADGTFRSGTSGWQDCNVVMQIPDNDTRVRVRYYLRGGGKVWSDGFRIEEVGADVPETHRVNSNMDRSLDER